MPLAEDQLAQEVEVALKNDSRTEDAVIDVINDGGVVTLQGRVESEEVRTAAATIAEAQPGIVEVINDLSVTEEEDDEPVSDGPPFPPIRTR
ncbi:MAG: BON domain-containing protein [Anaerolineales bacterium]